MGWLTRTDNRGFFLLESGAEIQMSRFGLLRSLLFQISQKRSHMLPNATERRWSAHKIFGCDYQSWSWLELAEALERLVTDRGLRFAILIDGLDEFDGDVTELAEYVLRLAKHKNIKMRVASRPWLVFEKAFQNGPQRKMEALTLRDIRLFMTKKPHSSQIFMTMQNHVLEGVFFWVCIVIQSFIEGCRNGDGLDDLHARLRRNPFDFGVCQFVDLLRHVECSFKQS